MGTERGREGLNVLGRGGCGNNEEGVRNRRKLPMSSFFSIFKQEMCGVSIFRLYTVLHHVSCLSICPMFNWLHSKSEKRRNNTTEQANQTNNHLMLYIHIAPCNPVETSPRYKDHQKYFYLFFLSLLHSVVFMQKVQIRHCLGDSHALPGSG